MSSKKPNLHIDIHKAKMNSFQSPNLTSNNLETAYYSPASNSGLQTKRRPSLFEYNKETIRLASKDTARDPNHSTIKENNDIS